MRVRRSAVAVPGPLEALAGEHDRTIVAREHVLDGEEAAVRELLHTGEDAERGGLPAVLPGERASPEVVEDELVVVAVDDRREVAARPGVAVAAHHWLFHRRARPESAPRSASG